MTGADKIMRGLSEAAEFAHAAPDDGLGRCPVPPHHHVIGAWDTSFTGGREGVSCRRCHKTWLKIDGRYVATYDAPAVDAEGKQT